jgi:hypothetical protein
MPISSDVGDVYPTVLGPFDELGAFEKSDLAILKTSMMACR